MKRVMKPPHLSIQPLVSNLLTGILRALPLTFLLTFHQYFLLPLHADQSSPSSVSDKKSDTSKTGIELVVELDPYYTDLGLHIPLTGEPIPNLGAANEMEVYHHLFSHFLVPRFMLLEAAVFPMPVTGVYLKKNNRSFYDSAVLPGDINLIESITAGFQEPYAFSLFLGDMVNFVKPNEQRKGTNKGYMGYLVSIATEHIKKNVLIHDRSYELEWKLKGERNFEDDRLSWSFRFGAKLHEHPDISNVVYIGLRRSNLSFSAPFLSWLDNSSFEVKWDLSLRDGNLVRQEYIVGKKYPFSSSKIAIKLDVGLIWEGNRQYSGTLRTLDHRDLLLVLRPNIQF